MNWLRKPSTTGGIIYLSVLGTVLVGLVLVGLGAWRSGVATMGVAFGVATVSRAALPDERAGMLRIRRRLVDIVAMSLVCVGMLVLAAVIPRSS